MYPYPIYACIHQTVLNNFIILLSLILVEKFPDSTISDKSKWSSTLEVKCGWGKAWDPPKVLGCVDPRGCKVPPLKTNEIWGSYDDSPTKSLDVGTTYWYACRAGLFMYSENNFSSFIDMKCVNDPSGGPPVWSPPYDNFIIPFPECANLRKFRHFSIFTSRKLSLKASWKYFF
jgi:hypothetical protein